MQFYFTTNATRLFFCDILADCVLWHVCWRCWVLRWIWGVELEIDHPTFPAVFPSSQLFHRLELSHSPFAMVYGLWSSCWTWRGPDGIWIVEFNMDHLNFPTVLFPFRMDDYIQQCNLCFPIHLFHSHYCDFLADCAELQIRFESIRRTRIRWCRSPGNLQKTTSLFHDFTSSHCEVK